MQWNNLLIGANQLNIDLLVSGTRTTKSEKRSEMVVSMLFCMIYIYYYILYIYIYIA